MSNSMNSQTTPPHLYSALVHQNFWLSTSVVGVPMRVFVLVKNVILAARAHCCSLLVQLAQACFVFSR